jgi:hypothetical protein
MKSIPYLRSLLLATTIAVLSIGTAQADPAADTTAVIEKAEAARQKAASVGGEWRDTGKLIKKAKHAAKEENFTAAQVWAKQALHQGELGYQQAMQQKDVGFPSYLK